MKLIIPALWTAILGVVCAAVVGVGVWILLVGDHLMTAIMGVVCVLAGVLILLWYLRGTALVVTRRGVRRLIGPGRVSSDQVTAVGVVPGTGSATSAWMVAVAGGNGRRLRGGAWLDRSRAEAAATELRARLLTEGHQLAEHALPWNEPEKDDPVSTPRRGDEEPRDQTYGASHDAWLPPDQSSEADGWARPRDDRADPGAEWTDAPAATDHPGEHGADLTTAGWDAGAERPDATPAHDHAAPWQRPVTGAPSAPTPAQPASGAQAACAATPIAGGDLPSASNPYQPGRPDQHEPDHHGPNQHGFDQHGAGQHPDDRHGGDPQVATRPSGSSPGTPGQNSPQWAPPAASPWTDRALAGYVPRPDQARWSPPTDPRPATAAEPIWALTPDRAEGV